MVRKNLEVNNCMSLCLQSEERCCWQLCPSYYCWFHSMWRIMLIENIDGSDALWTILQTILIDRNVVYRMASRSATITHSSVWCSSVCTSVHGYIMDVRQSTMPLTSKQPLLLFLFYCSCFKQWIVNCSNTRLLAVQSFKGCCVLFH